MIPCFKCANYIEHTELRNNEGLGTEYLIECSELGEIFTCEAQKNQKCIKFEAA